MLRLLLVLLLFASPAAAEVRVLAFGDSLDGDLLRRDFTVNALALSLPELQLVDPTGGMDF